MIDLSGEWRLRDDAGGNGCALRLPGDGHTALAAAGLIPEPYDGLGELGARWLCERDWIATRTVEMPHPDHDLVVDGLDTVVQVHVNGVPVLDAANAFRTHRADLSAAARAGANEIAITFRSPIAAGRAISQALPYPVPHHDKICPLPHGNMLRKPQCDFGWDWNPALAPFGVWNAIRLEPRRPGRIEALAIAQRLDGGTLAVTVEMTGGTEGARATATLCGVEAAATVAAGRAALRLALPEPDLWWPLGQGARPVHDLVVTCGAEREARRLALRDVRLMSEPDAAGRSFALTVNGRPVFARGANWIPPDALAGRIDRERAVDLLRSAAAAHMNAVRVWGGGRYEPGWFYEACDALGLLVWQDLMFACNLYPATEPFLAEVAAETREQAARLSHHVALWCGDNELVGALGWYPESLANRDRYLVAYDRLNRTLEAALRDVLPGAAWWPSSPSPGPLDFGDTWHEDGSGDMHVWAVWHENRDFEHYRDLAPRFASEFGFQSYPSMPVLRRFAEAGDRNIASPVMDGHQKDPGGNARIASTMFRTVRWPETFEDFVYLSQVQQALAIETAISQWRGLKPTCMGTLYWQLNDTWPCASWSSLDHGGGWKLLHHAARRFYAPVAVLAHRGPEGMELGAVNDTPREARLDLTLSAATPDGAERVLAETRLSVPTDRAVTVLPLPDLAADEIAIWRWGGDAAGTAHRAPRPYKALPLRPARVAIERAGGALTLRSEALALFVAVEAERPFALSDNAVLVTPGHPVTIRLGDDAPDHLTTRDLHAATHPRDLP